MLKYILFDLDETLYPASNGLMPAVGERMRLYLEQQYSLSPEDAHALQKRYWSDYGTTLRGLMLERQIDPLAYLIYVHDVDITQYLTPDPALRDVLERIPYERVIVTNADVPHAERVLERLGITDLFSAIFDIVFMEYDCKPASGAFERVLEALNVRADECLLVEDSYRNLVTARGLGMRTILLLPHALPATVGWMPDPALSAPLTSCPPEADLCISDIYQVADAIAAVVDRSASFTTPAVE